MWLNVKTGYSFIAGGGGGGRNLGDQMVFRVGTEGDQSSPTEYKGETRGDH